jgi:hypothetical protein
MKHWYHGIKEAVNRLRPNEETALPSKRERGQWHIESKALRNDKNRNICANCMSAYRDKEGNVRCGNGFSGYTEELIKKPFEHSCRKWRVRRKEQPPIFKKKQFNKAVANYARMVDAFGRLDMQRRGIA